MWAAVSASAGRGRRQDVAPSVAPEHFVEPLPKAGAGPAAMKAEAGARQPDHAAGIARGWERPARHPLAEMRSQDGGVLGRAPAEARAPASDRGVRQHATACRATQRDARRAFAVTVDEDAIEDGAANVHRVVRAGFLEGRQRRERRVRRAPTFMALDGDVPGNAVDEDEVSEVVAVLREPAVRVAPRALRGRREFESPFVRKVTRDLHVGLERSRMPGIRCHLFAGGARARRWSGWIARAYLLPKSRKSARVGAPSGAGQQRKRLRLSRIVRE